MFRCCQLREKEVVWSPTPFGNVEHGTMPYHWRRQDLWRPRRLYVSQFREIMAGRGMDSIPSGSGHWNRCPQPVITLSTRRMRTFKEWKFQFVSSDIRRAIRDCPWWRDTCARAYPVLISWGYALCSPLNTFICAVLFGVKVRSRKLANKKAYPL